MEIGRDDATIDSPIQGAEKDVIATSTYFCSTINYCSSCSLYLLECPPSTNCVSLLQGPGRTKNRKSVGRLLVGPQCAVCGEEAPQSGPYRRHYGVICCEACKCFFRRTVQMNKHYECKLTGNCAVGKNVRHWCQACRFQKCIKSGMKTEGRSFMCVHVSLTSC